MADQWLALDPVACDGVGMCAHLAPALVPLDRWGYPLMSRRPLDDASLKAAKAAVAGCPRKALFLSGHPARGAR